MCADFSLRLVRLGDDYRRRTRQLYKRVRLLRIVFRLSKIISVFKHVEPLTMTFVRENGDIEKVFS